MSHSEAVLEAPVIALFSVSLLKETGCRSLAERLLAAMPGALVWEARRGLILEGLGSGSELAQ